MLNADGPPIDECVVIVGVCGSGKSTLAGGLQALGYPARVCVQEHSYVPRLWMRRSRPRVLVHLRASLATVTRRRGAGWSEAVLAIERERLALAQASCDLDIDTDNLTIDGVRACVLSYLREHQLFGAGRDVQPAGP